MECEVKCEPDNTRTLKYYNVHDGDTITLISPINPDPPITDDSKQILPYICRLVLPLSKRPPKLVVSHRCDSVPAGT